MFQLCSQYKLSSPGLGVPEACHQHHSARTFSGSENFSVTFLVTNLLSNNGDNISGMEIAEGRTVLRNGWLRPGGNYSLLNNTSCKARTHKWVFMGTGSQRFPTEDSKRLLWWEGPITTSWELWVVFYKVNAGLRLGGTTLSTHRGQPMGQTTSPNDWGISAPISCT